jgi:hypothetical protein
MKKFMLILAVGLLAAMFVTPSAQADMGSFPAQQYLGNSFSMDSNGFHGTTAMVTDDQLDQSTCAAHAGETTGAWSTAQASALADAPHGGALHQQCVRAVSAATAKEKFTFKPLSKTALWKKRKQRCKTKCIFKVTGRKADGSWGIKRVRLSKHRRVLVVTAKKGLRLKGRLVKTGKIIGIGLGGCTNKLGQIYERITPIKFKLRLLYFALGVPKKKGDTLGPGGTGGSLPPAEAPATPPDSGTGGPTSPPTPPPSGGSGDAGDGGGCVDASGNPCGSRRRR